MNLLKKLTNTRNKMTSDPNSAKVHEITTTANLTGDQIAIRYVNIEKATFWDRNPKLHDIGGIVRSLELHGFRDAPIYDQNLNDGSGGIVAGNGRTAALIFMKSQGKAPPHGVAVDKDDNWYMPVQFGINAGSLAKAEAFGVDHNNLTMTGGDFGLFDIARMWDESILRDLLEGGDFSDMLASMDGEDMEMLFIDPFDMDTDNIDTSQPEPPGREEFAIRIVIETEKDLIPITTAVRKLLEKNPEWNAQIK